MNTSKAMPLQRVVETVVEWNPVPGASFVVNGAKSGPAAPKARQGSEGNGPRLERMPHCPARFFRRRSDGQEKLIVSTPEASKAAASNTPKAAASCCLPHSQPRKEKGPGCLSRALSNHADTVSELELD